MSETHPRNVLERTSFRFRHLVVDGRGNTELYGRNKESDPWILVDRHHDRNTPFRPEQVSRRRRR